MFKSGFALDFLLDCNIQKNQVFDYAVSLVTISYFTVLFSTLVVWI